MQGFYKFYFHLVHVASFLCSLSHKKILQPTVTKKKERRKLIYNPLTTAAASSHTTASFLRNAQAEERGSSFTIPPFPPRRQRHITTIDFPRPSPVGAAGAALRWPLLPLTLPVSPASSSSPLFSPFLVVANANLKLLEVSNSEFLGCLLRILGCLL